MKRPLPPGPARRRIPGVPADRGGYDIDDLVQPRPVKPPRIDGKREPDYSTGLDSIEVALCLDEFSRRPMIRELALEHGLGDKLFMQAYRSFKDFCLQKDAVLEPALLVTLHDIIKDGHDVDNLYQFFLAHAKKVFPHIEAMNELKMISDLTQPHNWYPDARTIQRKIIFHAGPTNSGKTYNALKRFREAKSGIYCGPLKLLAAEVFQKTNDAGVKCDMVTGEERRFAIDNQHPSAHISSTVEMLATTMRVEVAVIDEIQMLRDEQRGWAWTRALLGVAADEVHLCGEPAAVEMVRRLLEPMGETVEVHEYKRMSGLQIAREAVQTVDRVQPGDAIVCFSKRQVFSFVNLLEKKGIKPAIIYGDLPPGTKLAQAARFNDPNDDCDVLVSTDAIGMGLNLNIKRVIFAALTRMGELIPNYQALQIAGRAGRYGTHYADGVATTFRPEDIGTLRELLETTVPPIDAVGISPTYEQLETFSFHLPQASFVKLLDLFVSVCSVTDHFFICTVEQMRELALLIDYIILPLKVRYTFCVCPLSMDSKLNQTTIVKMARRFSSGQPLTADWLLNTVLDQTEWPPAVPNTLAELEHLENLFEIMDTYLWFSLRFPDMLPDEEVIRAATRQLDPIIQEGVENLVSRYAHEGKEGSQRQKWKAKEQTQKEEKVWERIIKKSEHKAPAQEPQLRSDVAAQLEKDAAGGLSQFSKRRTSKSSAILEKARAYLSPEELEHLKQAMKKE
ncbi:unnamed protein product, partial [Mesorhabditis spiculigera]